MKMKKQTLDDFFGYHPACADQKKRYRLIESKAKELAQLILDVTPESADQKAAIRKVREAKMTAIAAISCDPDNIEKNRRTLSRGEAESVFQKQRRDFIRD